MKKWNKRAGKLTIAEHLFASPPCPHPFHNSGTHATRLNRRRRGSRRVFETISTVLDFGARIPRVSLPSSPLVDASQECYTSGFFRLTFLLILLALATASLDTIRSAPSAQSFLRPESEPTDRCEGYTPVEEILLTSAETRISSGPQLAIPRNANQIIK